MSRSRVVFFLLSAVVVTSLVSGSLLGAADGEGEPDDSLYKHLSVFTEVLSLVRQAYVDPPDLETLMAGALDGTTDALDPFSLYVPPDQVAAYQVAREVGKRHSGLTLLKERGVAYVVAVDPGSPAAEAGVEVGDLVTEIGGVSTRSAPLWEVKELLAAPAGSQAELELLRRGDTIDVVLDLEPFSPPAVSFEEIDGAAVLRIPSFDAATAAHVREILAGPAAELGRLVVDLRGVAGGDTEAAYDTGGLFATGELGSLMAQGKQLASFTGEEENPWQGPVVVLISRGTLGPAEILAQILRDRVQAELVGERTFGWAGRLESQDLASGGRLYFTGAFYAGPLGEPLTESLRPDIVVRPTNFDDRDRSLDELILERGLQRLDELWPAGQAARKAA